MPIRLATKKTMWQRWSGGLTLLLMIICSPVVALPDLIVDNGETYTISADITNNNVTVGQNSTGTLLQGGYTNTVNNNLLLGENPGSQGTYNLSGGKLSAFFTTVGFSGTGVFNQSGGIHDIDMDRALTVGFNAGSRGVYNLSSGQLGSGTSSIGFSGYGSFIQSGGDHIVFGNLFLGIEQSGVGAYELQKGTLAEINNATIGDSGRGTFTQSGGSHVVEVDLILGNNAGSRSTYDLQDGSLLLKGTFGASRAIIGDSGEGVFTQTGGTHRIIGNLVLGNSSDGQGAYTLSGGSLEVLGNEVIGNSGAGAFTQTGGSHTVTGTLFLGANGGAGSYELQDGSLTCGGISVTSGSTFTQSSGILAISADSGTGVGTLNLNGGTLQASGGTHTLGNDIKVGGDFTLGGANNLTLSGNADLGGATRTLNVTNTGSTTLAGIISNGGLSLNNTGGKTLTLSGANTYSGGTTLTYGTLGIGSDSVVSGGSIVSGPLGAGTLTVATGTLTAAFYGKVETRTIANNIIINDTLTAGNGNNLTLNGIISGNGKLILDMC